MARAAALFLLAFASSAAAARADGTTIENVSAPILRVNVKQGNVTIRTWDRPVVQIDADPAVQIVRRNAHQGDGSYALPIPDVSQNSAHGTLELPAENFVVSLAPGAHDTIVVRDLPRAGVGNPTPVTVTVPNDTAFVFARTGDGTLDIRDYHNGTFVGFVGRGRMVLSNLGGTAFAQTLRGPTIVDDSSFDRFRARSLFGNITFERCTVRQIETTSIEGSIVYDGGAFQQGLARFESTRGNVAIGVTSAANLDGHAAADGHVYTNFQRNARVDERDGETNAALEGGGPLVTAMTQRGNVYFYDGSLRSHNAASPPWQAPLATLQRPAVALRHDGALPDPTPFHRFPDYRQSGPRRNFQGRQGSFFFRPRGHASLQ